MLVVDLKAGTYHRDYLILHLPFPLIVLIKVKWGAAELYDCVNFATNSY